MNSWIETHGAVDRDSGGRGHLNERASGENRGRGVVALWCGRGTLSVRSIDGRGMKLRVVDVAATNGSL